MDILKFPRVMAFTPPIPTPPYINITRPDADTVIVTVRGDARDGKTGPMATMTFTWEQWQSFYRDVGHGI